MESIEGCQLLIDSRRGVIWVNGPDGRCLLRICSLPAPIPEEALEAGLDVTYGIGCSWKSAKAQHLCSPGEFDPSHCSCGSALPILDLEKFV